MDEYIVHCGNNDCKPANKTYFAVMVKCQNMTWIQYLNRMFKYCFVVRIYRLVSHLPARVIFAKSVAD